MFSKQEGPTCGCLVLVVVVVGIGFFLSGYEGQGSKQSQIDALKGEVQELKRELRVLRDRLEASEPVPAEQGPAVVPSRDKAAE